MRAETIFSRTFHFVLLPVPFVASMNDIKDIAKDINVKNTRNAKSEAPILHSYRNTVNSLFYRALALCARAFTHRKPFFPLLPPPGGCREWVARCSGDFASSGIFLFARIKRACHAKRDRIDAFLINSSDDRGKEVTEEEKGQINVKTCDTPPEVARPTRAADPTPIIIARLRLYFNFLGRPIVFPHASLNPRKTGITRAVAFLSVI